MPEPKYEHPIRCYVIKAMQDAVEILDRDTFTLRDIIDALPGEIETKSNAISAIIAGQLVNTGLAEKTGVLEYRSHSRRKIKQYRITEKGRSIDWLSAPPAKIPRKNKETHIQSDPAIPNLELKQEQERKDSKTDSNRFDLVNSIFDYMQHLKKTISLWEQKYSDLENKMNSKESEWREVANGKTKTIQKLNEKISAMNNIIQRFKLQGNSEDKTNNLLSEVASFKSNLPQSKNT